MDALSDGDLQHLAEVEEISIGFTRPDGSTGSTPVWVVQAGDAIFVRSIRGRRGGWYRRLGANPDGEVGDGAHTHSVRARPVEDAGTVEAVTGADAAKYGDSSYVGPLLTEEAADATLGLEPWPSRPWPPADAHLIPGRTRPATADQTQGAGRRYRPHPTAPANTRTSRRRVIRRRRRCVRRPDLAPGVRARNLATDSPPKRARSSLGWDHAAAAKVRHCEGCSEARV